MQKNVSTIRIGLATCSEDNTVRFWNSEFNTVEIINMQGRVWETLIKENRIFIGSDEELCIFQELNVNSIASLREVKIFYNAGGSIFSVKIDEHGVYMGLGTLEDSFENFVVDSNGKMIGVMGNTEIGIYSASGVRKKYFDNGKDPCFIVSDRIVYLNGSDLIFVPENVIETKTSIADISKNLYTDNKRVILNANNTCVYSVSAKPLHTFNIAANKAIFVSQYFVLFDDQIHVFDEKFNELEVLDRNVVYFIQHDGVLFCSTVNKTFNIKFEGVEAHLNHLKY